MTLKASFPWGRVSKVHLNEAKERYITLARLVEHYKKIYENQPNRGKEIVLLECCDDILDNIEQHYLKRQEPLLNFAWRELIRVQVTIIDHLLPQGCPELLAHQVDAAREEAYRLAVETDPQVKDQLQQLAEVLDEESTCELRAKRLKRILRALHERFNSIRSSRMHQQYVNVWIYKFSLFALVIISIVLMNNVNMILEIPASGLSRPLFGEDRVFEWSAGSIAYWIYYILVEWPLQFFKYLI